ncbi:MAG TPA: MauE/DoxX family redox-associated membrane protein [Streptosporangiaceae bacterium]|nr:MauE/DoxX family redox-associated membrane protein [Streptosporangiaceae bacterium]
MFGHTLLEIREAQVPLLSAMLLGGCAAKLARVVRVGSMDAGLGPTALFPLRLRRPVAITTCAVEFACGVALIVTAGGLGRGGAATAVRIVTSLLFLVATCALIELRTSHPEAGCGCFGEFSRAPVSGRTLARSAFFAAAALVTIGLPRLRAPHPGADAARLLGIFAIELALIALLSPELGEALTRLGYSEPCELRRMPTVRTLAALRRSSQWRKRAGLISAEVPVDMWRELCWRYVVFPARVGDRAGEIVFAVYLRPHRPLVHSALVDSATGEVLPWPDAPARRRRVPAAKPPESGPEPSGIRRIGASAEAWSVSPTGSLPFSGGRRPIPGASWPGPGSGLGAGSGRIPAGMLSAHSDSDVHVRPAAAEPSAHSSPDDLPFSSDL